MAQGGTPVPCCLLKSKPQNADSFLCGEEGSPVQMGHVACMIIMFQYGIWEGVEISSLEVLHNGAEHIVGAQ